MWPVLHPVWAYYLSSPELPWSVGFSAKLSYFSGVSTDSVFFVCCWVDLFCMKVTCIPINKKHADEQHTCSLQLPLDPNCTSETKKVIPREKWRPACGHNMWRNVISKKKNYVFGAQRQSERVNSMYGELSWFWFWTCDFGRYQSSVNTA